MPPTGRSNCASARPIVSMTDAEALQLADQLVDAAEHQEKQP
ncbi:hypothetical protein ACIGKQ_16440 [Gordonia sp. NPDC062954]